MRKEIGKKNQRRNYKEESSAPKRRRTGDESYMNSRSATGDQTENPTGEKRKEKDEPITTWRKEREMSPEKKKRKTQSLMDKFLFLNQEVGKGQAEQEKASQDDSDQAEKVVQAGRAEPQCMVDSVDQVEKQTAQA